MSLEVFQNYGLFRRKQRTVPCEDILCHQRQDLVNKLFQLLGHSQCTELLQLDEFQVPYRQISAGFPNLKSFINLSKSLSPSILINLALCSKSLIVLLIIFFQATFDGIV
jgi:hypothetical protein